MIDVKTLRVRIKEILLLCEKSNVEAKKKFGSPDHRAADKVFWDTIKELDEMVMALEILPIPGRFILLPIPGRFIQWPTNGGYARYIIIQMRKTYCRLIHLPWREGFKSKYVADDGVADISSVKERMDWETEISRVFNRHPSTNHFPA